MFLEVLRINDILVWIWILGSILLFSSLTFKTPTKLILKKYLHLHHFSFTSFLEDEKSKKSPTTIGIKVYSFA